MTILDPDKEKLREHLTFTVSLQNAMETVVLAEGSEGIWKHSGFREYARKYVQLLEFVSRDIKLPPILDSYDIERMPGPSNTFPDQRQAIFESVHANLSLLRGFLETKIGVADDELIALRDFLHARLRTATFKSPDRERDVQDTIEQLFIGRGMQKGQDYDRETGRVKISTKEAVPDFVLLRLSLAMEVKLVKSAKRVKVIVDEISADIAAYAKAYRRLFFLIYDLGYIRDETEFRHDFEISSNITIVIIKH